MNHFEIELPYEIDEGVEVTLTVIGEYQVFKGRRFGHPDTYTEGHTEIEIEKITNEKGCDLPADVMVHLIQEPRFMRAVEDKIL